MGRNGVAGEQASSGFRPTWVGEIELGQPLAVEEVLAPPGPEHGEALLLVRLHAAPLGYSRVTLVDGAVDLSALARQITDEHRTAIAAHLADEGAEVPVELGGDQLLAGLGKECQIRAVSRPPAFSVALCTRDRPELARRSLRRLAMLDYPDYEVLLVDNAPRDDATRAAFEEEVGGDVRFRYLVEPRPGLSRARNRALAEARHRYVAFTDDDAQADASWLEALARGFARNEAVGCVTGLVPSAQLDTPAQDYFHGRVWWSSALDHHLYERDRKEGDPPLHPFRIGRYGTGANFAVERDLALGLGGFSELIGAGSPCRGGAEDGDMFVRVLAAGRMLSYEPAAIVWHRARPTDAELRQQLEEYGRGIFVTSLGWLANPTLRWEALRRVPAGTAYYLSLLWKRGYGGDSNRAPMALTELRGALLGPVAFVRGSLALRRDNVKARRSP